MGKSSFSLDRIGDQFEFWSRSPVHPTLVPFAVLGLVHAVRVSHATRQVAGSHKYRLNAWQGFLLNQILMFGGVIISGMLLGIPSPLFFGWPVVVLYGGMHVLLDITPVGKILLDVQDDDVIGMAMDLSFALLDGLLRAEAIIDLGIEPVVQHASAPLATSLFAAVSNAALIGGGVPLLIDLFKLDSPTGEWGIRTPAWMKDPFAGTSDLLSGGFIGLVYLALSRTSAPELPLIGAIVSSLGLDNLNGRDTRTFCSLLLGAILLAQTTIRLAPLSKSVEAIKKQTSSSNGSAKGRKPSAKKHK